MQKSISFKNANISFSDVGNGPTVVLIHGFLENATMWNDITPHLTSKNRVITIDLLGHGHTGCLGYVHSMEIMADAVSLIRLCYVIFEMFGSDAPQNGCSKLLHVPSAVRYAIHFSLHLDFN